MNTSWEQSSSILSLSSFDFQASTFKCTMYSCVAIAMDPPYEVNTFTKLWCRLSSSIVLKKTMFKYFKVAKMAMVQVLGLVEDECIFLTFSFTKSKLWNQLVEHLPIVVGMYFQTFYNLEIFPYAKVFDAWWVAKKYKIQI